MKRPQSLGIRHLALKVKEMKPMKDFYAQVLGFIVEWEPDPQNVYLSSGLDNLALHEIKQNFERGSLDHLGILVRSPGDVDDWAMYLKEQSVSLIQEPKTHRDGARSIYFSDPEQNVIQIICHPPISSK